MIILTKDRMGNFIAGVTGQIKLSERVALTADFTTIPCNDYSLDGANFIAEELIQELKRFYGAIYNGTVGITVYLGKMKSTLTG
jgi:OOP family OmpA-OmpF porin